VVVGVWAANQVSRARAAFAAVMWLYALSQVVFLAYFGGAITMKMAVLTEQTLMLGIIAVIATRSRAAATVRT